MELLTMFYHHKLASRNAGTSLVEPLESRLLFNAIARWSHTALDGSTGSYGTPVRLTWSIVPDGLSIPGRPQDPYSWALPSDLGAKSNALDAFNNWVGRMSTA